jgi:hypothetical protein
MVHECVNGVVPKDDFYISHHGLRASLQNSSSTLRQKCAERVCLSMMFCESGNEETKRCLC